ncbi:MAG: hypothetical protein WC717_05205 [Candidatus Micrarchaeia archaeon]|jgi:hypothetical protein
MLRIIHRINTLQELSKVPKDCGVEVDIRNIGSRLVLNHEPYGDGEELGAYCNKFDHPFMIANVKTEGIEEDVISMLEKNGIENFFLLDLAFPSIVKLSRAGEHRLSVRFSEYEPIESALAAKGMADWVWVDTFTRLPLDAASNAKLRLAGFRACLVCPERWGRPSDIAKYRSRMEKEGTTPDAVMTSLAHAPEWG